MNLSKIFTKKMNYQHIFKKFNYGQIFKKFNYQWIYGWIYNKNPLHTNLLTDFTMTLSKSKAKTLMLILLIEFIDKSIHQ